MSAVSKSFVLAGNATFTVEEPNGTHHTYRVQASKPSDKYPTVTWFASLLTGPDNESAYTYLGVLKDGPGRVDTTAKSKKFEKSHTLKLLNRVLARVWADDHQAFEALGFKLHHEGRCGRCGRKLTTPESVERGIGPECWGIMGLESSSVKEEPLTVASPSVQPEPQPIPPRSLAAADGTMWERLKRDRTGTSANNVLALQPSVKSMFASDLGLGAGRWPDSVDHDGVEWLKNTEHEVNGKLEEVLYRAGSRMLQVFND